MTSVLRVAAVAACLSLAACSSDGATPGSSDDDARPAAMTDAEVCGAIEQWGLAFEEAGATMSVLGDLLSAAENPETLPSPETVHDLGADILASADDADEALAEALSGIDDATVVTQLQSMNDATLEMARWLGQAAVDSDGALDFSLAIMAEMDRMETFYAEFETLDLDAAGEYLTGLCGSMSGFGDGAD